MLQGFPEWGEDFVIATRRSFELPWLSQKRTIEGFDVNAVFLKGGFHCFVGFYRSVVIPSVPEYFLCAGFFREPQNFF